MTVVIIFTALLALVAAAETDPAPRIDNGNDATPGQFPYQAMLRVELAPTISFCAGSILSNNYILTSASCVFGFNGGTAIVGAHNVDSIEPSQQSIRFASEGITVHPEYSNSDYKSHDVATIRLENAIEFNDLVQPIKIPTAADLRTFAGFMGTVSGYNSWGNLRFITNPIPTNANCLAQWQNRVEVIQSQHVCLSGQGGRSPSWRDAGGPLVVQDEGESLLVGIVSFQSTTIVGIPSVYARVSYFRQWIVENSDLAE